MIITTFLEKCFQLKTFTDIQTKQSSPNVLKKRIKMERLSFNKKPT
jgi:hypothetical protein